MNTGNFQTAPHGILLFAAFALAIILFIHFLGFRVVAAVRVGR